MNDISFYQITRKLQARCASLTHAEIEKKSQKKRLDSRYRSIAREVFSLIHQDSHSLSAKPHTHIALLCRVKALEPLKESLHHLLVRFPLSTNSFSYLALCESEQALMQKIEEMESHLNSFHRFPLQFKPLRKLFEMGLKKRMNMNYLTNKTHIVKDCFHLMACSLKPGVIPSDLNLKLKANFECAGLIRFADLLKEARLSLPPFKTNQKFSSLERRLREAYPFSVEQFLIYHKSQGFNATSLLDPVDKHLLTSHQESLQLLQKASLSDLIQEIAHKMSASLQSLKKNELRLFLFGATKHRLALEIKCSVKEPLFQKSHFEITLINRGMGILDHHENRTEAGVEAARAQNFRQVQGSALGASFFEMLVRLAVSEPDIEPLYSFLNDKLIAQGKGERRNGEKWMYCPPYGVCTYSCIDGWLQSKLTTHEWKLFERFKFEYTAKKLEALLAAHSKNQAILREISPFPPIDTESADWQILLDISRAHLEQLG